METFAPWAVPVLMTADDLWKLPDDGWRYELVEGRLVRMSPTGPRHSRVDGPLFVALYNFVSEHALGEVFLPQTGFCLSPPGVPDTVLAPDVAIVRAERRSLVTEDGFPRLAPDLVVEIASPSQSHPAMRAKADQWLEAGVRLVWLVSPDTRTVEVKRSDRRVVTLGPGEMLEGEDVLPGFVFPVSALFQ